MISLSIEVDRVLEVVSRWYSGLSSRDPMVVVCLSGGRFW